MGPIMETLFPSYLLPHLFSLSVPVYRPCLGIGTILKEEKRSLSNMCSWEEAQPECKPEWHEEGGVM